MQQERTSEVFIRSSNKESKDRLQVLNHKKSFTVDDFPS